ncbi:MAG: rod shape-determining protein RodA [Patescibacteria group bacterium]
MNLRRFDWLMILAAFVLFSFGIATITSVELSRGAEEFVFVRKQLIALGIGLGLFGLAASVNYQLFRAYSRLFYGFSVLLLVAVLLFGQTLNGTTGWFIVAGFSFQPVELMKFALALELARYFSDNARERFGWRELVQSGVRAALPILLVLKQPDLGGAIILMGIWAIMVFFAGIRWQHVALMALVLTLVVSSVLVSGVIEDYQRERVMTFLNPSLDPLDKGYNIAQAKIAIGAGGFFGRGLGAGSQSQLRFLPESQTDFIFAVIAEELGFIGVILVLGAFLLLFIRLLSTVRVSRDAFAAYLLIGIFATFFVQTFIHVGVNLSIMPATGVTLPLVSYGGSSLLIMLTMLGAAESVASRITPVDRLVGNR